MTADPRRRSFRQHGCLYQPLVITRACPAPPSARARSASGRLQGDGEAGIHGQDLAGDVGGGVGGQEDGAADQLVGAAEALERDAARQFDDARLAEERTVALGQENPVAVASAAMPLGPSSTASARISASSPPLETT